MSERGEEGQVTRLRLEGDDGSNVELSLTWRRDPGGSAEDLRTCDGERAYMVVRGEARMRFGE